MEKIDDTKKEFAELLSKATQAKPSFDLTASIMNKIQRVDIKSELFDKYMKRSWFFIGLAILLALKAVSYLDYFQVAFGSWVNGFLPGAIEFFIYTILASLAGLFFYQLNSLLEKRVFH